MAAFHEEKSLRKKFACEICNKEYCTKSKLTAHIKSIHEAKGESVPHGSQLNPNPRTNKSIHEGKKPFECDKCDSTFTRKHGLKYHLEIVHEKWKPFKCQSCSYGTSSMGRRRPRNPQHGG